MASCYLQRSCQRRLSGPSDRPGVMTTIWSQRAHRPIHPVERRFAACCDSAARPSRPHNNAPQRTLLLLFNCNDPMNFSRRRLSGPNGRYKPCFRRAKLLWVRFGRKTLNFIITLHKQRAVVDGGIIQSLLHRNDLIPYRHHSVSERSDKHFDKHFLPI